MIKNTRKFVWGIFWIIIGVVALISSFNLINFSVWSIINTYWPIGLIIGGVLLLCRQRFASVMMVLLTLILYFSSGIAVAEKYNDEDIVTIEGNVDFEKNVSKIDFNLDFGMGYLEISGDDISNALTYSIDSYNSKETLRKSVDYNGDKLYLGLARDGTEVDGFFELFHLKNHYEDWNLNFNKDVLIDMDLNYGASEVELDLTELKVENLNLEFGASDNYIVFGKYPTKVKISSGASSTEFVFPKDYPVIIEYEGGASSTEFEGFERVGNTYRTQNFIDEKEYIYLDIEAGASSFFSSFGEE